MTAGYKLSLTYAGLTDAALLPALGLIDPKSEFKPAAIIRRGLDGHDKYLGDPQATWNYGYWTPAWRAIYRGYCPGASAAVYIETLTDADAWAQFKAIMHWPEEKKDLLKVRIPIAVLFTNLEIQGGA